MTIRSTRFVLLAAAFSFAGWMNAAEAAVTLTIDPPTILPGLSIAFLITLPPEIGQLNEGDQLPMSLLVTSESSGESSCAIYDESPAVVGFLWTTPRTVRADRSI